MRRRRECYDASIERSFRSKLGSQAKIVARWWNFPTKWLFSAPLSIVIAKSFVSYIYLYFKDFSNVEFQQNISLRDMRNFSYFYQIIRVKSYSRILNNDIKRTHEFWLVYSNISKLKYNEKIK